MANGYESRRRGVQAHPEYSKGRTVWIDRPDRRAAISIPSNIAEGASRAGTKEFLQFLYIARGSASELETQLLLAEKLGYLSDAVD